MKSEILKSLLAVAVSINGLAHNSSFEFKVEITYNCPFCNNNQNEISVNGDGVYCVNCNEDMDYGRSFRITKKVNCINHGINYERVPISYDIYDNTLNPPSYKPL